jgi:hypothetical protein
VQPLDCIRGVHTTSPSTCDRRSHFTLPLRDANSFGLFWLGSLPDGRTPRLILTTEIDMIIPDLDCGYVGMRVGICFSFGVGVSQHGGKFKAGRGGKSDSK